jgi:hypothetical protein
MNHSPRVWIGTLALLAGLTGGALAQTAPVQAPPCDARPECRQLDFWVGEWTVTDHGREIASSSIQRIVGDCVVFENYAQPDGYSGKSLNFFDGVLGKWRQTWVDALGNVSEFTGEYRDHAMHFEGETNLLSGKKVLRRMTLTDLGGDRVRQYSERSSDGGKTWDVAYDYLYVRRK